MKIANGNSNLCTMIRVGWIACLLSLSCASAPVPAGDETIGWEAVDESWSLHVVTLDPDGDERVTRIWIAVAEGDIAIRTGESRWWRNLHRDPTIRIRLSGVDYPLSAEFITVKEDKIRIDEAFADKYRGWEQLLFPQPRGETHENYALLRPQIASP